MHYSAGAMKLSRSNCSTNRDYTLTTSGNKIWQRDFATTSVLTFMNDLFKTNKSFENVLNGISLCTESFFSQFS